MYGFWFLTLCLCCSILFLCVTCLTPFIMFVCLLMLYARTALLFVKTIPKTLSCIASVNACLYLFGWCVIYQFFWIQLIKSSNPQSISLSVGIPVLKCLKKVISDSVSPCLKFQVYSRFIMILYYCTNYVYQSLLVARCS